MTDTTTEAPVVPAQLSLVPDLEAESETVTVQLFNSKPYVHIQAALELGDLDLVLNVEEAAKLLALLGEALTPRG